MKFHKGHPLSKHAKFSEKLTFIMNLLNEALLKTFVKFFFSQIDVICVVKIIEIYSIY